MNVILVIARVAGQVDPSTGNGTGATSNWDANNGVEKGAVGDLATQKLVAATGTQRWISAARNTNKHYRSLPCQKAGCSRLSILEHNAKHVQGNHPWKLTNLLSSSQKIRDPDAPGVVVATDTESPSAHVRLASSAALRLSGRFANVCLGAAYVTVLLLQIQHHKANVFTDRQILTYTPTIVHRTFKVS